MTWETLLNQLPKSYTQQDVALVQRAYEVAERAHGPQLRKSGEAYIVHPMTVAQILADLRLDAKTVAAALLHDVAEDTAVKMPELAEEFGPEVASMVDGVTKLSNIADMALCRPIAVTRAREPAQDAAGDGQRCACGVD